MRQECLFLLRFLSFVQFLFSSQFLLPALIHDFAGRATRTKLLQVAKNERMFLLFLIDSQKAWFAAATFLQPRADLKAAPGKERKAERFPTARNSASACVGTNTSPSPPFPPPVFNVANGIARKAS